MTAVLQLFCARNTLVFPGSSVFPSEWWKKAAKISKGPNPPSKMEALHHQSPPTTHPTRTFGKWYCKFSNTFSKYQTFWKIAKTIFDWTFKESATYFFGLKLIFLRGWICPFNLLVSPTHLLLKEMDRWNHIRPSSNRKSFKLMSGTLPPLFFALISLLFWHEMSISSNPAWLI